MIIAGLMLGAALPAQAQFKKLKGAITRAVPQVVTTAAPGGGVRTADLQFDDRVLEITPARIEQLIRGIEAGQAMAARVEAQDLDAIDRANVAEQERYSREFRDYEGRKAAWDRCSEQEMKGVERQTAAIKPSENDRARMEAVAARIKAGKERGDMAEVLRLTDSLTRAIRPGAMKATEIGNAAPAAVKAKCGDKPQEPARPVRQQPMTWDAVDRAEIEASGLTAPQYQILRERVAPFIVSGGKSSPLVYTDNEVSALRESQSKLEAYTGYFKRH
jgi:hypothetical protein